MCLDLVTEVCHLLAIEPRSSKAAHSHRTAQEWAAAPTPDGRIGAPRGAAPHPGQRGWEGLSHYDGPYLLPAHPPCHWLHLWQRYTEGGPKPSFEWELNLVHRRMKSVLYSSWIPLMWPTQILNLRPISAKCMHVHYYDRKSPTFIHLTWRNSWRTLTSPPSFLPRDDEAVL